MKLHQLSPWITTFPFLPWLLPWWSTLLSSEDCMLLGVVTNISCLSCSAGHPQHHANGWGKAQLLPPEQALASCGDHCCSGPGAYCSQGHAGADRFLFCFPSWKFGWFCYVAPACVEESELSHPSSVFCEASCGSKGHNWPPALFCFVYLPCLLSQRYEQGGMIRRALSSLWHNLGKDLSHNNASLTCQAETWQLLLSKAAWNVGTKMSLLPYSTCRTKISFQEEYKF